ncbi:hypothetical protein [Aeromicrobium sp.]|uniref:hypothetical protein n=1 Tax=Aeromicrobium sp. TaxID=1871063 RepID=UPI0019CE01C4|nr:hypothetical protein [Aeromicrobium sp.]MBC7631627.1 hypothetical protein [Aeromicrobium sp.]
MRIAAPEIPAICGAASDHAGFFYALSSVSTTPSGLNASLTLRASFCWLFLCLLHGTNSGASASPKATHPRLWREMSEPAISVGGPDGGGSHLPQLLIEIPATAGYAIGFALAIYIVCRAILIVLPMLSDKAARRLALVRGHRITHKRK